MQRTVRYGELEIYIEPTGLTSVNASPEAALQYFPPSFCTTVFAVTENTRPYRFPELI